MTAHDFFWAIAVRAQNFSETNLLSFVLVGAIIRLLILLPPVYPLGLHAEAEEMPPTIVQ